MVTGGWSDGNIVDSTELYDPNVRSWNMAEAKLPGGLYGLRAINIGGRHGVYPSLKILRLLYNLGAITFSDSMETTRKRTDRILLFGIKIILLNSLNYGKFLSNIRNVLFGIDIIY